MWGHFESIGLSLRTAEELAEFVDESWGDFVEEFRAGEVRHLRWTDASGASLAAHVEEDDVVCVTPFFDPPEGLTQWTVRSSGPREDAGCVHCGAADVDILAGGDLVTRTTVQWLHFLPYRSWLHAKRDYSLSVAAFAEQVSIFPDEDSFHRGPKPGLGNLALTVNAFLPIGMLSGARTARAATKAAFSGRIAQARERRNTRGGSFWHLRIETLPGAVDVVAAPGAFRRPPVAGEVGLIDAWIIGRPVSPP